MFLFGSPQQVLFPDDFINPELKDKNWHTQYVQAAYYAMFNNAYYSQRYNQWQLNELYAQGKQPIDRYVKALCDNQEENYMNINWRQVSILPKVRDIVIGYLTKVDYGIDAAAINPDAIQRKEEMKWQAWAEKEMFQKTMQVMAEQELTQMAIEPNIDVNSVPNDINEYELLTKISLKLKEEIQAELGSEAVLEENEWDVVKRIILEQFFDNGLAVVEKRVNRYTGNIEVKSYPMSQVVLPTYTGKTGEKVWIGGVCEPISVHELYKEAGDQFTADEYKEIAKRYDNTLGNPQFDQYNALYGNNISSWRGFNVYRVRIYWYSTDVQKYVKVTKNNVDTYYKAGYERAKEREEKKTKDGKTIIIEAGDFYKQTVREASWILGTNYVYNWGDVQSYSRDQINKRECMLPISVYKVSEQSRVERSIPFVDGLSLSWYKLQDRKSRAIPSGITVDLSAIEKMVVDNKQMSVKQILNLAIQTGLFLYRSEDSQIPEGSGKPIEARESSWGIEAQQYVSDMDWNIQMINKVVGVNEFMDATTPPASSAATVAKIAAESALNGLSDIVDGMIYLTEKTVIDIAGKLQRASAFGLTKLYSQKIGKWIDFESEFSLTQLGIKVYRKPMQQEKDFLINYLVEMSKEPSSPLDTDDFFKLKNIIESTTSMKYAEEYVSLIVGKRRKQKAEEAQQNGIAQAKAQAEAQQELLAKQSEIAQQEFERQKELISFEIDQKIRLYKETKGGTQIEQSVLKSDLKKSEKQTEKQLDTLYGK